MATVIQKAKIFRIKDINENLCCFLCRGYLIDATTIIECLHSFCRSCLINHLKANKNCPFCDCLVHKTKPLLNIRSDATLQDLVFKLIPGLYQDEISRRKNYLPKENGVSYHKSLVEEGNDDYYNIDMYSLEDNINVELKYIDRIPTKSDINYSDTQPEYKKYFQCPASFTIESFKNFIQKKYLISNYLQIELYCSQQCLYNSQSLLDVASFVSWQREKPLEILFTILEPYFEDITDSYLDYTKLDETTNLNGTESCNMPTLKISKNKSASSNNTDNKDSIKDKVKEQKQKSSKLNKSLKGGNTKDISKNLSTQESNLDEKMLLTVEKSKDENEIDEMEDDDIDESRKDLMKIVDRACSKLILGDDDAIKDSEICSSLNNKKKDIPQDYKDQSAGDNGISCVKEGKVTANEEPICRELAEVLLCLSTSGNITTKGN